MIKWNDDCDDTFYNGLKEGDCLTTTRYSMWLQSGGASFHHFEAGDHCVVSRLRDDSGALELIHMDGQRVHIYIRKRTDLNLADYFEHMA